MEISKKELEEFKTIYKAEFGIDLSDAEAREIAQRLLGFVALIYRPLPEGKEPREIPHINF
jgi:hypothetical protein